MTLASEDQKGGSTSGKKLERQEGQRIRQNLHAPELYIKAMTEKKVSCKDTKERQTRGEMNLITAETKR